MKIERTLPTPSWKGRVRWLNGVKKIEFQEDQIKIYWDWYITIRDYEFLNKYEARILLDLPKEKWLSTDTQS